MPSGVRIGRSAADAAVSGEPALRVESRLAARHAPGVLASRWVSRYVGVDPSASRSTVTGPSGSVQVIVRSTA